MEGVVSLIDHAAKTTTAPKQPKQAKRTRKTKTVDDLEPIAVTVTEAMRLMGTRDNRIIYGMIRRGEVKARKIGRMFFISYASMKELMGEA
ncbi:helix-turn-helix domain-containing protein [Bifidobacterium thermacidophilum]|uniref:Helix-turn-helix domain-containing protein n=1 Tax=Bifidobacterium thermacidophilum subsp. thermacidophilum TaxID=79262 RepID=A0A087EAR4_9BIFI|nr:helix-turn-helix domain-containing protein [Bifidobacterium thermacidophilum]KFJ04865.1 hypothetical protein THER5_1671 [Bifidobacterium thermacidophilum subsp. thermacidophilum]